MMEAGRRVSGVAGAVLRVRTWAWLGVFLGAVTAVRAIDAQRPERPQEVRVPGSGIVLHAGWQLLTRDRCRFTVPREWRPDAGHAFAFAPDGSSLSVTTIGIANWAQQRARMLSVFGPVTLVHEDSARRLWFEFGGPQRHQHYVSVIAGESAACVGIVETRTFTSEAVETATRIADSLAARR
jgi:hypothetical protein